MFGGGHLRASVRCGRILLYAAFLLQFLSPQKAIAAGSVVNNANRDATRIQQQNLQQQQNLEKELRKRKSLIKPQPELPPPAIPQDQEDSNCLQIDHIKLEGMTRLHFATIDRLISPYQNACLSLNRINHLLHDITNAYFTRGYVTTRAYLKPQNLGDKTLRVSVVEGRVSSLEFADPPTSSYNLPLIFPGDIGDTLNLRWLEQGLDNLNRLQSNNVRLELTPGNQPGDTRILLKNEESSRVHLNFGINNSGQESTGELQGHAGFGLDNPFGMADYFSLLYARELSHEDSKKSRSISGSYELPFGMNRLQLAVRGFRYNSMVEGTGQTFTTNGTSSQLSANLERTVLRNQKSKTTLSLMGERKEEDNFLEDVKLDSSSRTLAVARLKVSYQRQLNRGSINFGLTAHRGLKGFGADEDSALAPDAPRAQFDKLTADLNLYYELPTTLIPLSYSLTGHGQYTTDLLFSTERLGIGGLYSVRGYKNDNLSGDRGGYLRNELSSRFNAPRSFTPIITSIRPFVAFDFGAADALSLPENGYQELRGWAFGFSASGHNLSCQLSIAKAIDPPAQLSVKKSEIYFSLSFRG